MNLFIKNLPYQENLPQFHQYLTMGISASAFLLKTSPLQLLNICQKTKHIQNKIVVTLVSFNFRGWLISQGHFLEGELSWKSLSMVKRYPIKGIYGGHVFQAKDKLDYFCIFTSSSNFSAFSGVARNK